MNKVLSAAELQEAATITTLPPLSKKEKLDIFVEPYLRNLGQIFVTASEMEHLPLPVLRDMTTVGTPFELGVQALDRGGIPTAQTFGSLMDSTGLTSEDIHDIACGCRNGNTIDAVTLAVNTGFIADEVFSAM